jgi:predicted amidophosphoribosyltransferase
MEEALVYFVLIVVFYLLFGSYTISCYCCGGEISREAEVCPHCGQPIK